MSSRNSRAADVAARLSAVIGHEATTEPTPECIRITIAIPPDLSEAVRRTVLLTLASLPPIDRYGHDRAEDGSQTLWIELH